MLFIISAPGGCSQILKNELKSLGYPLSQVLSPSTVQLEADESAIAKINLRSRVANKVYVVLGTGIAPTFERLFDIVKRVDWATYIGDHMPFVVNARSSNSLLTSLPAIQSMGKKSISKKLLGTDGRWEEDEQMPAVDITLSLDNNNLYILLNTSGDSLHKRGYRTHAGEAPLKENLAASLVLISGWKFSDPFFDPMCGSGTLLIEAAMIAKNIAPGMKRYFAFEDFTWYSKDFLNLERAKAIEGIMDQKEHMIRGADSDKVMIAIAKENAANAGVGTYIDFSVSDAMEYSSEEAQCIISNPPYGQRMQPENLEDIYKMFDELYQKDEIYGGIITSFPWDPATPFETKTFYNGPEKVTFWKKGKNKG